MDCNVVAKIDLDVAVEVRKALSELHIIEIFADFATFGSKHGFII